MKKEVSPSQAIIVVIIAIGLISGIWWFAKGYNSGTSQRTEVILPQNPSPMPPSTPDK